MTVPGGTILRRATVTYSTGAELDLEVRPTSRFSAQVAVGRTSINRLAWRGGQCQKTFSAAPLGLARERTRAAPVPQLAAVSIRVRRGPGADRTSPDASSRRHDAVLRGYRDRHRRDHADGKVPPRRAQLGRPGANSS